MHQAPIQQALHIFRKDVCYLRNEIALILLLALAFAAIHVPVLHAPQNSWLAELALVALAAFLIGRLVLAEAIPGDRQFWITRPYRWQSLLGARLGFIVVFVNLPLSSPTFSFWRWMAFPSSRTCPVCSGNKSCYSPLSLCLSP